MIVLKEPKPLEPDFDRMLGQVREGEEGPEVFNGNFWQPLRGRDVAHALITVTGRFFWPMQPHPSEVHPMDIAHGLAMECRFGNQYKHHNSVAWHSVALSYIVPKHLAKWALIHDASEAYMIDVPRCLKRQEPFLSFYTEIEDKLLSVVAEALDMEETTMPEELHYYDSLMSRTEMLVGFGDAGEAKLRAMGRTDEEIKEGLAWSHWVKDRSNTSAKLAWQLRFRELFNYDVSEDNNQG